MDDQAGKEKKRWYKRVNWLWATAISSGILIYGIGLGMMLGFTNIWCFLTTTRNLNEVGDFLAGVFAPLAVILLLVAVFMQRQELDETREQFDANRIVTTKQLDLITTQNDNAKNQALRDYKLSLFNHRIEVFNEVREAASRYRTNDFQRGYSEVFSTIAQKSKFIFGDEMYSELLHIGSLYEQLISLSDAYSEIKNWTQTGESKTPSEPADQKRYARLKEMETATRVELEKLLSYEHRSKMFEQYLSVTDEIKEKAIVAEAEMTGYLPTAEIIGTTTNR